jgi:hypothetical protein
VTADLTAHANGVSLPYLLRPAAGQDRVTVLADAMRGVAADPEAPEAQRKLAAVAAACTSEEYEAAWRLAAPPAGRRYDGPPAGVRMLPVVPLASPPMAAAKTPPVRRLPRRWPLLVIGSAAAVAIWSGWVALGAMCGFGLVEPLPGITRWRIDTAITLPVSMEAYGAYALGVWLSPGTPERARKFAACSAMGSLVLGTSGQVIYHLLAAAGAARAPWPVVVLVSCIPVAALAMAAALAHLLREAGEPASSDSSTRQDAATEPPPPAAMTATPPVPPVPPVTPSVPPKAPVSPRPRKPPAKTVKHPPRTAKAAKADAAIAANPGKTNAEIAAIAGVSERTVERRREAARKAAAP